MRKTIFPKLAAQSMLINRQFYFPYLLTVVGTAAGFYDICALATDRGMTQLRGAEYVQFFATFGLFITAVFALIFLFYTNSFLMKRRNKELGLYNILGMGKGHVAMILVWEFLYTALIGIVGGLAVGVFLHKLVSLALYRLLRLEVPFGFEVSLTAVVSTVLLFLAILLLTLLSNLRRITFQSPIALLRGDNMGEREPRTRWLLALLGILTLGGGYTMAMVTQNSQEAMLVYFLAVFLVIIGTYCLFTAVSIAVLKLLRKNKKFYYKTSHFIGISGMLYRMKQNAVGLANICILSTMVLVMLSGTLSLYIGMEDVSNRQAPTDLLATVYYFPEEHDGPDIDALADRIRGAVAAKGQQVTEMNGNYYYATVGDGRNGSYNLYTVSNMRYSSLTIFTFITAQDYAALTGQPVPELAEDEVLLYGIPDSSLTFSGAEDTVVGTFRVKEHLNDFPSMSGGGIGSIGRPAMVVVKDFDALVSVRDMDGAASQGSFSSINYEYRLNITGTADEKYDVYDYLSSEVDYSNTGDWLSFRVTSRERVYSENFGIAGGFLFLGVFLGVLFIMAAVLIIYYKQIGEGYEDQRRFHIMEQVGLTQREIRRSINSQVLTVFFLPLLVAAVHVAFDFRLMLQLLQIFSVTNVWLTALCTLGVFAVFALLYALVFSLTARVYYRIVSR